MSSSLPSALRETAALLETFPSTNDELRALQAAANAIAARQVEVVGQMVERRDHETEGASSVKNWLRDHLHLDSLDAHTLVTASQTLTDMPRLANAADAGAVSLEHVRVFTWARKHIEAEHLDPVEGVLIQLAVGAEPRALQNEIKRLREYHYPDDLDEAWIKGMDRQDIKISAVPDGWHLNGFLPFDTGGKLKTLLQSLSAPTCPDDDRPVAQRRVTALDQLLTTILESGLPQDKGVRPHLDLTVDLAELTDDPDTSTATLAGFGSIGPAQLQQMLCDSSLTPILTAGRHTTLDVGRTARLATPHQRRAIYRQHDGQCAGPGCRAPVVHLHHITYWSHGGQTDMTNLIGLCPRCHALVHQEKLRIDPETRAATHSSRLLRNRCSPSRDSKATRIDGGTSTCALERANVSLRGPLAQG